jgi:hypothetical protein
MGVILQSHQDQLVKTKAEILIESLLLNNFYSEKGLEDWKNVSKKGL